MSENGGNVHLVISNNAIGPKLQEQSTIYSLELYAGLEIVAKQTWYTKHATQANIIEFNNDTLVTFTNTYDVNGNSACVNTMPLKMNSTYGIKPVVSIFGCHITKVIAWKIDSNSFILVSLNSGLYNGRESAIYHIFINGTYSVLQRLPTFHASDALFLKIQNELFLIIANEYQKSDWSFVTDYNVPVQIFR